MHIIRNEPCGVDIVISSPARVIITTSGTHAPLYVSTIHYCHHNIIVIASCEASVGVCDVMPGVLLCAIIITTVVLRKVPLLYKHLVVSLIHKVTCTHEDVSLVILRT
jgi:hypothetical protein